MEATNNKTTSSTRVRHARKTGKCLCGRTLESTTELVHVSGWYGDWEYVWRNGRLYTVDAECGACRYRRTFTPVDGIPDDVGGGWWVLPRIPALDSLGEGSQSIARCWERLREYARQEMLAAGKTAA